MKRSLLLFVLGLCLVAGTFAQKPWSEWDKKEVDKMLNGSAWGQTQNETFSAELTAAIGLPDVQKQYYNYRIRFFSARPVREAFARQLMLANPKVQASQLQNFVNGDYSEMIVVAVTVDGEDRRLTGPLGQDLAAARTDTLKNKVYLERKDGKRLFLQEYAPPGTDGTGAKFVFPRMLDGKPFLAADEEYVRFVGDVGRGTDIKWKFKIADMIYDGKLEY
jgi:hypothetical protein